MSPNFEVFYAESLRARIDFDESRMFKAWVTNIELQVENVVIGFTRSRIITKHFLQLPLWLKRCPLLTPFQAERVLLISKLRELVIRGHSPIAIQSELGISQRQYYRLYQKAFEHDCRIIEQWDSDTFKEDLAIYKGRQQRILAFSLDKMDDPKAYDITRRKAAVMAAEISDKIFRTSYEGVFQVKKQAGTDIEKYDSRFPLLSYLNRNDIRCETLTEYKKAQYQLDKEEEDKKKRKKTKTSL